MNDYVRVAAALLALAGYDDLAANALARLNGIEPELEPETTEAHPRPAGFRPNGKD